MLRVKEANLNHDDDQITVPLCSMEKYICISSHSNFQVGFFPLLERLRDLIQTQPC